MLKLGGYVQVRYLGAESDDVAYAGVVLDVTRSRATIELVNTAHRLLTDRCELRVKVGGDVYCYTCRILVSQEGSGDRGRQLAVEVTSESSDIYVREVFRHTVPDAALGASFGVGGECRVVALSPHGLGVLASLAHEVGSHQPIELRRGADAWSGVAEVRYVRATRSHGIHHGLLVPASELSLRRGLGELSVWVERLNLQAAARVRERLLRHD